MSEKAKVVTISKFILRKGKYALPHHRMSASNNLIGMTLDTGSIHRGAACPFKVSIVVASTIHKVLTLAGVYRPLHLFSRKA